MTTLSTSIKGAHAAAITIQLVGGPTVVFEIGGVRLLTDPTFDPPGDHRVGRRNLIKTGDPAISVDAIGHVDAVLLSHDQHPDNLDDQGRKLIERVPLVLTTAAAAAQRLGGTTNELPISSSQVIARPDGGELKITGYRQCNGCSSSGCSRSGCRRKANYRSTRSRGGRDSPTASRCAATSAATWAPVRRSIASSSGNNGRPALDKPLVTDITDPASSRTTLWPDSIGLLGGTALPACCGPSRLLERSR